jgi:hypothetical protein
VGRSTLTARHRCPTCPTIPGMIQLASTPGEAHSYPGPPSSAAVTNGTSLLILVFLVLYRNNDANVDVGSVLRVVQSPRGY